MRLESGVGQLLEAERLDFADLKKLTCLYPTPLVRTKESLKRAAVTAGANSWEPDTLPRKSTAIRLWLVDHYSQLNAAQRH